MKVGTKLQLPNGKTGYIVSMDVTSVEVEEKGLGFRYTFSIGLKQAKRWMVDND